MRRDGAYTWHRADLSEAHALAAIADGSLRVTTPAGETLDFVYERHEEHPSGDWTWVGRLERGSAADEVVLTFGDRAAFGTIAQPGGEPLRLTIRDGASWLIETDAARVADIHNRATRPEKPDYLVPPSNASAREASASGPAMASAPSTEAATTSSAPVIDLVLGYTPGFATMYGGQSQAVTRLNNLVAITNEAYANSEIAGRVRLVHTLQVNYADNTDNGDTLEKLTGYKSGTGWITPDPAFNALRAARDQYGADLVSLVRKFNDPENDGCGIAWMIGGGGSSVDTGDAPFGYSVVSDGEDKGSDGKTYFCRHETLAHEIGHNLGSQHDKATATKDGKVSQGAFAYSFGYKTDSANGNFYTVMAYGDSGQTRYRAFSNPRITFCGGRVCGMTDQADNARSHEQTMPVVASFRATKFFSAPSPKPKLMDLNGDGKSDLVWTNGGAEVLAYWHMNASTIQFSAGLGTGGDFKIEGSGDLNADSNTDVIVRSSAGQVKVLFGDGSGFGSIQDLPSPSMDWQLKGIGDIDGNGTADLLWYHSASATLSMWLMSGGQIVSSFGLSVPAGKHVYSVGDYDGNGRLDLLVGSPTAGLEIWQGTVAGFVSARLAAFPQGWSVVGSADVDGDGKADLLWRHSSGTVAYWRLSGPSIVHSAGFALYPEFSLVAVGDYDGNGRLDIAMRSGEGAMHVWYGMPDGGFLGWGFPNYPSGWMAPPIR